MIIDAHYHLDEQVESVDALLEQMQLNNGKCGAHLIRIWENPTR